MFFRLLCGYKEFLSIVLIDFGVIGTDSFKGRFNKGFWDHYFGVQIDIEFDKGPQTKYKKFLLERNTLRTWFGMF